jgi:hypothetical protein
MRQAQWDGLPSGRTGTRIVELLACGGKNAAQCEPLIPRTCSIQEIHLCAAVGEAFRYGSLSCDV